MKLSAIRVQNVGVLQAATALDGLTGRLDVIAAPNEAGKSTLFRAVTLALSASYSSKSSEIRQLQSAGGGAPLIEIDFETADGAWRLSKRYLSKATARLTPLAGGLAFDNADAEEKLRALIGHDLGDHGFRALLAGGACTVGGLAPRSGWVLQKISENTRGLLWLV